jgi:hypothetical protein
MFRSTFAVSKHALERFFGGTRWGFAMVKKFIESLIKSKLV